MKEHDLTTLHELKAAVALDIQKFMDGESSFTIDELDDLERELFELDEKIKLLMTQRKRGKQDGELLGK